MHKNHVVDIIWHGSVLEMKLFKIILIVFLCISPAFAEVFEHPVSLKKTVSKLPELGNRTCKFSQEKTLPTNLILKSSGDFEFKKDSGVTFYTTYPVKTTSYPQNFSEVNNIIKAISTKSYGKLEKDFNFFYESNGNEWTLGLKPKFNSKIKNFLKSIEIKGTEEIDKMVIISNDGTKTEIVYY